MKKLFSLLFLVCMSFAVTASPPQPPNVSVCKMQEQNTIELACVTTIGAAEFTTYKTFVTDDTVIAQTVPVMEVVFAPPAKVENKLYSSTYNYNYTSNLQPQRKHFIKYGLIYRNSQY